MMKPQAKHRQRSSAFETGRVTGQATTLVAGIGNPLRRDDGVGPALIRRLRPLITAQGFALVEREPDMIALLDELQEYARAVIVDAVDMGAVPGSLRLFTAGELQDARLREISSTHGFGLRELAELAGELGVQTEILVAGIQVRDVSFGEELSTELAERLEGLAGELGELLGS